MESTKNKWQINRAGLFNYWYYEDEVFDFAGGKLLLRGNNGAGKSVTMQSFLPVLLDGSTRPERLDPFNSRARRMEDYLLGEKEVSGLDERTGYLYMEFKKNKTDQYMTIGIGLNARRGKPLNFWGFVLTDNRRVGKDILLYKVEKNEGREEKIPLSRIQLRNQVGEGGHVVETRKEYAGLVNQYIFGYESIEEYEDLIKLLIQLRSPKLSKEFKPSVIFEILEEALPPLSDEDLRYLSDTIEHMDQTKQQLEQSERESEAVTAINKVYTTYNQKVLYDQAKGYREAVSNHEQAEAERLAILSKTAELNAHISELNQEISDHEDEKDTADKQRTRLIQHEIWNLEKEKQDDLKKLQRLTDRLGNLKTRYSFEQKKERVTRDVLDQTELSIKRIKESLADSLDSLSDDASRAGFSETHSINEEDFKANTESPFQFNAWVNQAEKHYSYLQKTVEELREFESLKNQHTEKDSELGKAKLELDRKRDEEKDWESWLSEEKQKQLNAIHEWLAEADYLHLSEEKIQHVSRALDRLFVDTRYEQIEAPIRDAVSAFESDKLRTLAELETRKNAEQQLKNDRESELSEWKNRKDPDPDTHPLTKEARIKLKDQGIRAVPLYNAVEFHEGVPEATQNRLEAALIETGLLDALITAEGIEVEHDRVLRPDPQLMAYTLADFLKPDLDTASEVTESQVDDVLRSILIDDSSSKVLSLSEDGRYTIGPLVGHAVPVESVRFIGSHARERYREEQIVRIQKELKESQIRLDELDIKMNENRQAIVQAKAHLLDFPDDEDLSEGYSNLLSVQLRIERLDENVNDLSETLKAISAAIRSLKVKLDRQTISDGLQLDLMVYVKALDTMRLYEKGLAELKGTHLQLINHYEKRSDLTEKLIELEGTLLDIKDETATYQRDIDRLEKEIEQIEEQMAKEGVQDIKDQIQATLRKLSELDDLLKSKQEERTRKETELTFTSDQIVEKESQQTFWNKMKIAWAQTFSEESKRNVHSIERNDQSLEAYADTILLSLDHLSKQEISQLSGSLSRKRNDHQDNLIEYGPVQRTVYSDIPDWMNEAISGSHAIYVERWKNARSRELVELHLQGKRVSPYLVADHLKSERERQQVYLDKQDRKLYEEILFQSVGNKLRARIGRAERWVEEMKALMESRNDSSGLLFSIRWKPRTAETEDEMDTKDLLSLLRQKAELLSEEDIAKVTTHFRTKISRAKALMKEGTEMQTLLQVLKQVLDYRNWFSFELSYQRTGDGRKRQLTDNQFYKFSGGEKARAMYIPLFIASYSRYLEASDEAPFILSMDEAFAGVDDHNIADLFEVLEELGFNYIINSQGLWGDYPTVTELAISELFRPQNADHVAVIRYVWDGSKRRLIAHEES
ncbi:TIGR02680 family protein [Alkalibacterium subtropicum]|uniref:TIGR02680 family protein n=1 Tax=Alkalibacterium subtropicum TaxID=753702 RepID=A0A1I1GD51_9LACT|nr:TIGR02680 family protein [Alkalibacterium subtropicum]SFC09454.1 TIGR02680 family protein [Alkalibacterium subtropicum]